MVSEIRKFGVSLRLGHQQIAQLSPTLRDAVLGSVGTKVVCRVGIADAEVRRHEFPVTSLMQSIAGLAPHTARISTPRREYLERRMPKLPNERDTALAKAIGR